MAEKSRGSDSPQGSQEKSRRDILRSTKAAWAPLDEQLPPGSEGDGQSLAVPMLEDSKQERIQQWLDWGFFVSANEKAQQVINHTVFLHEQGTVQMTVEDSKRSLHQFSETPTLSRGTSFNSCYSAASVPQSIPEWLEFWEKDPVEILLDLGFGVDEPDICTQIPARFLVCDSAARGINIQVFLEAQKQRTDVENPNLYGRFRQLEILDHVATAFSSLLDDVSIPQNRAEEEVGGESVRRTSVSGASEHHGSAGEPFSRASQQTTRRAWSLEASKSLEMREEFSIDSAKPGERGAELPALTNNHGQSHLSPLAEHWSLQACDDLTPCHPPRAVLRKQWPSSPMLAKQVPPSCESEGSVRDRTRKENSIQTSKPKNLSRLDGKAPDSFEMEEVQSSEEETGNPLDLTSGATGATVSRAHSAQSDSSGFLEEPPEPPPVQTPLLPGSRSAAENGRRKPVDGSQRSVSPQDCQPEPEECGSGSTVSVSFSSQGWSVLEEKASPSVVGKAPRFEAVERPPERMAREAAPGKATTGGEPPGTDRRVTERPPLPHTEREAGGAAVASSRDRAVGCVVTRIRDVKDGPLRPEGVGGAERSHPCESPSPPGMDRAQDRFPRAAPAAPRAAEGSTASPHAAAAWPARARPRERVPQPRGAAPCTADPTRAAEQPVPRPDEPSGAAAPHAEPRRRALGQTPPGAASGTRALPPGAGPSAASAKSVTIQMSAPLAAAAPNAVASGAESRTTFERTVCDPVSTAEPGRGTEAKQLRDVSVQTDAAEPRARPPTKSGSLDSGSPGVYPAATGRAVPARCCVCCHRRPHCHADRRSLGPGPSACRHCPRARGHRDAQGRKTAPALRDAAVRELCSGPVHEMEAMQRLCQGFREHLEEVAQHLTGQQALLSRDMSEEERKEAEQLQTLRKALRQQVEELEFQLGVRAQQIREGILLVRGNKQLELLAGGPPERRAHPRHEGRTEEEHGLTSWAQIAPVAAPGAASPPRDGQQAPCTGERPCEDTEKRKPSINISQEE